MTLQPFARILRSRATVAAASAAAAVAVFGTTFAFANHDAITIHACLRNQTGAVRIVQSPTDCTTADRHQLEQRGPGRADGTPGP